MSAYICCPKCGENTLDVDTLRCDCGYSSSDDSELEKLKAENAELKRELEYWHKEVDDPSIHGQFINGDLSISLRTLNIHRLAWENQEKKLLAENLLLKELVQVFDKCIEEYKGTREKLKKEFDIP